MDVDFKKFYKSIKTIAVVGASDKVGHAGYHIPAYLKYFAHYKIIPVNPKIKKTLDEKVYPNLLSIPKGVKIDVAEIFRPSAKVFPHVQEAIKRGGIKTIWMQEGIISQAAAKLARKNGLEVVMDDCMMQEHIKTFKKNRP